MELNHGIRKNKSVTRIRPKVSKKVVKFRNIVCSVLYILQREVTNMTSKKSASSPQVKLDFKRSWSFAKRQMRLMRTKLVLWFLVILIVPSACIGYFSYQSAEREVEYKIRTGIYSNVALVQSSVHLHLTSVIENLKLISTQFKAGEIGTAETQQKLDRIKAAYPELEEIVLADGTGAFAASPKPKKGGFDPLKAG